MVTTDVTDKVRSTVQLGRVAHSFNLSSGGKGRWTSEFKASLGYVETLPQNKQKDK